MSLGVSMTSYSRMMCGCAKSLRMLISRRTVCVGGGLSVVFACRGRSPVRARASAFWCVSVWQRRRAHARLLQLLNRLLSYPRAPGPKRCHARMRSAPFSSMSIARILRRLRILIATLWPVRMCSATLTCDKGGCEEAEEAAAVVMRARDMPRREEGSVCQEKLVAAAAAAALLP